MRDEKKETGVVGSSDQLTQVQSVEASNMKSQKDDFISQLITHGVFTTAEVSEFSEQIKKRIRFLHEFSEMTIEDARRYGKEIVLLLGQNLLELLWHGDQRGISMRDAKGKPYRVDVNDYPSLREAEPVISAKQNTAYDLLFAKNPSGYAPYFYGAWSSCMDKGPVQKARAEAVLSRLSAVCSRTNGNAQANTVDVERPPLSQCSGK